MPLCAASPQRRTLSGFPMGSGGQCLGRLGLHASCCSVSFFSFVYVSSELEVSETNTWLEVGKGWTCVALFLNCVETLQLFLVPSFEVWNGNTDGSWKDALGGLWSLGAFDPAKECVSGRDSGHVWVLFETNSHIPWFFWFTDIHVCQKALLRGGLFMFCSQTFTSVKEHSSEEASSNFVLKHSCFPVLFTNIHLCQKALLRGVFFICGDQNHSSEEWCACFSLTEIHLCQKTLLRGVMFNVFFSHRYSCVSRSTPQSRLPI